LRVRSPLDGYASLPSVWLVLQAFVETGSRPGSRPGTNSAAARPLELEAAPALDRLREYQQPFVGNLRLTCGAQAVRTFFHPRDGVPDQGEPDLFPFVQVTRQALILEFGDRRPTRLWSSSTGSSAAFEASMLRLSRASCASSSSRSSARWFFVRGLNRPAPSFRRSG